MTEEEVTMLKHLYRSEVTDVKTVIGENSYRLVDGVKQPLVKRVIIRFTNGTVLNIGYDGEQFWSVEKDWENANE